MDEWNGARALDRGLEQHAAYLGVVSRGDARRGRDRAVEQWALGRAVEPAAWGARRQNLEQARELGRRFPEGAPAGWSRTTIWRAKSNAHSPAPHVGSRPVGGTRSALRAEMQKIEQAMAKLPGERVAVGRRIGGRAALARAGARCCRHRPPRRCGRARAGGACAVHEHATRRPRAAGPRPGRETGGAQALARALENAEPQAGPALEALERELARSAVRAVRRVATLQRSGWVAAFVALGLGAVAIVAGREPARVPAALVDAAFVAIGLAAVAAGCFLFARASRPAAAQEGKRREVESRRLDGACATTIE
jgi:hypothetical protein